MKNEKDNIKAALDDDLLDSVSGGALTPEEQMDYISSVTKQQQALAAQIQSLTALGDEDSKVKAKILTKEYEDLSEKLQQTASDTPFPEHLQEQMKYMYTFRNGKK